MNKRTFMLEIYAEAVIELDETVITQVDYEWRDVFYKLYTPEDIAEHVGFNLIVNKLKLSSMDGWANLPDKSASIIEEPDWEFVATEGKECQSS